ncbi:MAG: type I restriction enzyme HsdR N-terminal domain-containing protein [Chloroflexota bacterium]
MKKLNLPEAELRIRQNGNATEVFDPLRKKFVVLTEEEWVRQNIIQYLHIHKDVPMHMMASERGLVVNGMPNRFDLVVFGLEGKPVMIVECKAPHIAVKEDVFYQAARYNLALQVKYLLITNGLEHHCVSIDYSTGKISFLEDIVSFMEMKGS